MDITLSADAVTALVHGDHGAPFELLGPHQAEPDRVSIRAFRPNASEVHFLDERTGQPIPMVRMGDEGFFEEMVPGQASDLRYHLEAVTYQGKTESFADPYAFPPILSDYDLHLLGEGRHLNTYDKFGAHLRQIDGIDGVHFAVWAPNARRVSVIGDFNGWDVRVHPMRFHEQGGVWELFIPGLAEGEVYKFDVRSRFNNYHAEKTDPYGFFSELRPRTASIVADLNAHQWNDAEWMEARAARKPLNAPMAIYEVHLGSWRRNADGSWLNYRELAHSLVEYARTMHYTHLELMPIAEHPLDASWGYQAIGYYAPTSRYGSPQDFMYFVDYCHQHGIGVILDWVPAHFPKDGHGLSYFDGTHLYEHADPRQGEQPDWGTYVFNFGRHEVRNFLISNALFWLKVYHVDGLRVDAVSSMLYLDFSRRQGEWIANQYGGNENLDAISFLKEANEIIHREFPGAISIAEESTSWPMVSRPVYIGGLGFTFKWNMGWMHDTLDYMHTDPLYRRYKHGEITFSMTYAFSENFVLSLSHDEVVHGKGSLINKMPGDWWQQFASLRLLYGYQYTHPGKKLLFMGQEFGQWREWSEERALDWDLLGWDLHGKLQAWVRDLNRLHQAQPALYEQDSDWKGYRWIEANDAEQSVLTFLRFAENAEDFVVVACNFTPAPRYNYRIGVPAPGHYRELLNSDSAHYGGGDIGNMGGVHTEPIAWHAWPQSLSLTVPPLATVILKPERAASHTEGNR
jgi:1,4-alpha-glucan branching enzyme